MGGRPGSTNWTGSDGRLDGLENFQKGSVSSLSFGGGTQDGLAAFGRRQILVRHRKHKVENESKREMNQNEKKGCKGKYLFLEFIEIKNVTPTIEY